MIALVVFALVVAALALVVALGVHRRAEQVAASMESLRAWVTRPRVIRVTIPAPALPPPAAPPATLDLPGSVEPEPMPPDAPRAAPVVSILDRVRRARGLRKPPAESDR